MLIYQVRLKRSESFVVKKQRSLIFARIGDV